MRFMLQSLARQLARDHEVHHGRINQRVCQCLRRRKSTSAPIPVLYDPEGKKAHLGNLQTCSDVWLCAVCGAQISERRLWEMTDAFERHPEYCKALVTFTLRHRLGDELAALVRDLEAAITWMRQHRQYKALMKRLGCVGHIRALEVLHNEKNGWHPHFHELPLFDHELTTDELADLEKTLKWIWGLALERQGRTSSWANRCDVRMGDKHVQEYLEKFDRLPRWTAAHELTKSQSKTSGTHGRTPNELLLLYGRGDKQAGELWREYAAAFRGRKQLVWSRGLKKLLGVDEKSDEEILDEQDDERALLATLEFEDYALVLEHNAVGELLNAAASGKIDELRAFLAYHGAKCSAPGDDDDERAYGLRERLAKLMDYANDERSYANGKETSPGASWGGYAVAGAGSSGPGADRSRRTAPCDRQF